MGKTKCIERSKNCRLKAIGYIIVCLLMFAIASGMIYLYYSYLRFQGFSYQFPEDTEYQIPEWAYALTDYIWLGVAAFIYVLVVIGILATFCVCMRCCFRVSQVIVCVFCFILSVVYIVAVLFSSYIFLPAEECQTRPGFGDINQVMVEVEDFFCHKDCKCPLDANNEWLSLLYKPDPTSSKENVTGCYQDQGGIPEEYQPIFDFMAAMEQTYSCAGFCTRSQIYVFTNGSSTKDGKTPIYPIQSCSQGIYNALANGFIPQVISYFLIALASYCFYIVVLYLKN